MKTLFIIVIIIASFLSAETFNEYEKRQKKEFNQYQNSNKKEFSTWKANKDSAFKKWQAEFEKYQKSGLRRIAIDKSESAVSKYDINYKDATVNVSVVANGDSKKEAIKSAVKVVNTIKTDL